MRVLLTVPSLDIPKFKGLAKFSVRLAENLKDKVDLEILEVYKGGYKEKIKGKELMFCCMHCANSYKKI